MSRFYGSLCILCLTCSSPRKIERTTSLQ